MSKTEATGAGGIGPFLQLGDGVYTVKSGDAATFGMIVAYVFVKTLEKDSSENAKMRKEYWDLVYTSTDGGHVPYSAPASASPRLWLFTYMGAYSEEAATCEPAAPPIANVTFVRWKHVSDRKV